MIHDIGVRATDGKNMPGILKDGIYKRIWLGLSHSLPRLSNNLATSHIGGCLGSCRAGGGFLENWWQLLRVQQLNTAGLVGRAGHWVWVVWVDLGNINRT